MSGWIATEVGLLLNGYEPSGAVERGFPRVNTSLAVILLYTAN
jgi:hypothetical protein